MTTLIADSIADSEAAERKRKEHFDDLSYKMQALESSTRRRLLHINDLIRSRRALNNKPGLEKAKLHRRATDQLLSAIRKAIRDKQINDANVVAFTQRFHDGSLGALADKD